MSACLTPGVRAGSVGCLEEEEIYHWEERGFEKKDNGIDEETLRHTQLTSVVHSKAFEWFLYKQDRTIWAFING